MLFLETNNGKVKGAESTPFELPGGWDFESLQNMIADQVQLSIGKDIIVSQLYYKKHGRSKAIVAVNGDRDIGSMIREYPGFQTIFMAVDWLPKGNCTIFTNLNNQRSIKKVFGVFYDLTHKLFGLLWMEPGLFNSQMCQIKFNSE